MWQKVPYKIHSIFLLMCAMLNLQIQRCERQASCLSPCGWGSSPCHQCRHWFWLGCWRQKGTCQLYRELPVDKFAWPKPGNQKISLRIPLFFQAVKGTQTNILVEQSRTKKFQTKNVKQYLSQISSDKIINHPDPVKVVSSHINLNVAWLFLIFYILIHIKYPPVVALIFHINRFICSSWIYGVNTKQMEQAKINIYNG